MPVERVDLQVEDRAIGAAARLAPRGSLPGDDRRDQIFLLIPDDVLHRWNLGEAGAIVVGEAAGHQDRRGGVSTREGAHPTLDPLPRAGGDGAGIHDDEIEVPVAVDLGVAELEDRLSDPLGVVLVQATAVGEECGTTDGRGFPGRVRGGRRRQVHRTRSPRAASPRSTVAISSSESEG